LNDLPVLLDAAAQHAGLRSPEAEVTACRAEPHATAR
jgi:hypothetical protein